LVGLRSSEIVESVRLINDKEKLKVCWDESHQCLQHYKFQVFIRQMKKCFISLVTPDIVQIAKSVGTSDITYKDVRYAIRKVGLKCDTRFCRKIHATHLRQSGIAAEIIDSLQGRTPSSVFAKHYYGPSLEYKDKVLQALNELKCKLE
jgi:intergrase/recombinase